MIARNTLIKMAAFAAFVAPMAAMQASALTFDFSVVLTGDTPVGDDPWARVTIDDIGANTVRVTLENLTDPEDGQFLTALYLNIDPFVDVTASNFVDGGKFNPDSTVFDDEDAFGSANYTFDLFADFDTTNSGGGEQRINGGEFVSFDLTGTGLSSASFLALSSKDGAPDTYGMIHIQGIPGEGEGSSKIGTVPEPASMAVLGLGAAALLRRRRKNA
jgi:hypothetical protein